MPGRHVWSKAWGDMRSGRWFAAFSSATLVAGLPAAAAGTGASHVLITKALKSTPERLATLTMPPGFHIAVWAENLGQPRVVAVAPNGNVYISDTHAGTIMLLRGGEVATFKNLVRKKKDVIGLAVYKNHLYYATAREIFASPIGTDGGLGPERLIAKNLPPTGELNDRTIAFGPDGWLYESVGSNCNDCQETTSESATIVRMRPDGTRREVFASGLRNTIGFAWQPGADELYGWDNGVDGRGDNDQPEELNRIERGRNYGWPYVLGNGELNHSRTPPHGTLEDWDRKSVRPALIYTAHSASMQMLFYTGSQFPHEYRGDAFATMHGSWNRDPPSGYEIVRVHFRGGRPVSVRPFVTGFLAHTGTRSWARFARPFGLAQMPDGSLLMGDDQNGILYRITYSP